MHGTGKCNHKVSLVSLHLESLGLGLRCVYYWVKSSSERMDSLLNETKRCQYMSDLDLDCKGHAGTRWEFWSSMNPAMLLRSPACHPVESCALLRQVEKTNHVRYRLSQKKFSLS